MVQVLLEAPWSRPDELGESEGLTRRTCWVSTEKKPKVGSRITLKNSEEPDRLWTVVRMSEPVDSTKLHTDWKVGGL